MLLLLIACTQECPDGSVLSSGTCVPDTSGRTKFEPQDTGDGPDTDEDTDDSGDTAETAASPDLDDDGTPDALDCDDDDPDVNPDAAESCDFVDNDCDGDIDEGAADGAPTWYVDADGDGYGDGADATVSCFGIFGYVDNADDCDDADAGHWPGAVERCNGADDDCDGTIDEDDASDASAWYADADGDAYGDATIPTEACEAPAGYVADATDCDDADAAVNPAAAEIAGDLVDNDCDGGSNGNGLDGERSLGEAATVLYGGDAGDYAGVALAAAGDLDGDGEGDLVVGAPFADDGATSAGTAYVLSLKSTGSTSLATAEVSRYGDTAYDLVGFAVAVADLDGDGADDLVVGAPGDDKGGSQAGAVWLLPGPITGPAGLSGTSVTGDLVEMGLGRSLAHGDLDADGDEEVLAGAPFADGNGTDAGGAWLLDGDGTVLDTWTGEAALDEAATAVVMGDLDGDGAADLAIGAPEADRGAGAVYVLVGGAPLATSLGGADLVFAGGAAGDRAGAALAIADVDEDGAPELLVGTPDADDGAALGGAVYMVGVDATSWDLPDTATRFLGDERGLHVGGAVAAGGDVDGDGHLDVLVGAPESDTIDVDAGEAFVLFGPLPSATATWDGRLQGEDASAFAGHALGFASDPTGAGYDDALIGAYGYDQGGFAAGAVYLMRGGGL